MAPNPAYEPFVNLNFSLQGSNSQLTNVLSQESYGSHPVSPPLRLARLPPKGYMRLLSDIDDDLATDEEYHEALLGYHEARDLMKEARVARGSCPVVVPFRSDKPTGRGKGDSSSVKM